MDRFWGVILELAIDFGDGGSGLVIDAFEAGRSCGMRRDNGGHARLLKKRTHTHKKKKTKIFSKGKQIADEKYKLLAVNLAYKPENTSY